MNGNVEKGVALDRLIVAMPKAELHVHLEGTVKAETLRALAARHGVRLPTDDEQLRRFYQFRDFSHFVEIFVAVSQCLREPADFERVTRDLGEEAARQNIRYLEVFFSPEPHVRKRGISFEAMLGGMNAGRDAVRRCYGIEMRWIADGVRDADVGADSVTKTVEWLRGLDPAQGVLGLGLGGSEVGHPPAPFADAFVAARRAGLRVVAHAGETTGPETIWATLRHLGAERIGHGIRAIEDPELVAYLVETGTPLEVCPTSNLRTGVVASPEAHPFRALDDAGVFVTVNSDDPPMFGTTLTDEFRFLVRHFGYDADGIERIALNAVRASFLPEPEKTRLLSEFEAEFAARRHQLGLSRRQSSGSDVSPSRDETGAAACSNAR